MLHPIVRRAMLTHPFLRFAFMRVANNNDDSSEFRAMAPLMNQFLKVSFLEGFLGKQPNTLTNRAASVLSKVLRTLESGDSDPLVDPLLAKYSAEELLLFFKPENKPYQTAVRSLVLSKFRALRTEPYDLMQSLIMGLNPVTGGSLSRTKGRPLFWYMGHLFAENPRKGVNKLSIQVNSFAKTTLINFMRDISSGEVNVRTVDIDTPIGGTDDGDQATIGDSYAAGDDSTSFDFLGAMSDRDVQDALRKSIISRINDRADRAHGNSDAETRKNIELAIWNAIQSNPDLVTDVDETYNFSIKQNELGNAVNSLTGLQKAVPYIAKVFRETVANDIKQALASSSVQRILDSKTDIARTYQSDIRRRASRRLMASAKRVAARYAATR